MRRRFRSTGSGPLHEFHRHLHPPAGSRIDHQPADPGARRARLLRAAGPAISADRKRGRYRHHDLLRRGSRRRRRLHHHTARNRDRAGLRHRLHDVDQPEQHQHDHCVSAAQLRCRQGADRDQHQDQFGAQPAADRNAAAGADGQDRADHRCDVSRVQQRYARAEPDHRLSHACRSAQAPDHSRRADGGTAWAKSVRAARLARSAEARCLRPDRERRQRRAHRQRFHIRHRHHQGPDGAGQSDRIDRAAFDRRVPQPRHQTEQRRGGAVAGRRQRHARRRGLRIRGRI